MTVDAEDFRTKYEKAFRARLLYLLKNDAEVAQVICSRIVDVLDAAGYRPQNIVLSPTEKRA